MIVEQDGRYYVQATNLVREVTMEGLEAELEKLQTEMQIVLAREEAEFESKIAEVEHLIDLLNDLQDG